MLKRFIGAVLCLAGLSFFTLAFAADPYQEALSAYQKGNYRKTVEVLQDYVQKTPSAEAYYLLGYANYKLGNLIEADKYFDEAYLINPDLAPEKIIPSGGQQSK